VFSASIEEEHWRIRPRRTIATHLSQKLPNAFSTQDTSAAFHLVLVIPRHRGSENEENMRGFRVSEGLDARAAFHPFYCTAHKRRRRAKIFLAGVFGLPFSFFAPQKTQITPKNCPQLRRFVRKANAIR
jgi:hypothetical protein